MCLIYAGYFFLLLLPQVGLFKLKCCGNILLYFPRDQFISFYGLMALSGKRLRHINIRA